MNLEEAHKADLVAISAAIQILFKHLPIARKELSEKIPSLSEEALFHTLTDEQIARVGRALQLLTRSE